MTGVIDLFTLDLNAFIDLHEVVGLKPRGIGYTSLVFKFKFRSSLKSSELRKYMIWWFKTKLHGEVGPFSNEGVEKQVWWVTLAVEIKEDRDRVAGGDPVCDG